MKHTKKKRILALVLCMVLVLSTGIAAFANENVGLQSVACSATNLERVIKNADGEQIGTLTADVPEGAFFASSSDANIQMEVEPDSGEAGVLNRVQQQMETEGVTGYEINNYVMDDVTFYVNGEKQTPQQPITFHVSGTNIDTQNVTAFADDRQNTPVLMDATTDENDALQFTAQTSDADTVVYGIYDVTAAETADTTDDVAVQTADDGVATQEASSEIATYAQGDGITLTDDIIASGKLKANLTGNVATEITNASNVTFTWEKTTDGGKNYTSVSQKKSGDNYNIPEASVTDQWLDVALDGGALNSNQTQVGYRVKVTYTVSGKTVNYTSDKIDITYWNELQNGSFETPELKRTTNGGTYYSNWAQLKVTENPSMIWKTTGSDGAIEYINTKATMSDYYYWYGTANAEDGNQFAELNCEAEGALYQDVLTNKGTQLNYWFAHRARGAEKSKNAEYDTMYVVIMPTATALTGYNGGEIDTQEKLKAFMESKGIDTSNYYQVATSNGSNIVYDQDGILIRKIDSDDQSWHYYDDGTYTPTNNLTRFFFVSGATAAGQASGKNDKTVGNFLDKVGFSQELPPANPGTFNLRIKKTITGTDNESVRNNLKFTITSTNKSDALNGKELLGKDAKWSNENGNWVATWIFNQQKISYGQSVQYTIVESDADLDKFDRTTSIAVTGGTNSSTNEVDATAIVTVKEKDSVDITFTNNYSIADGAMEVGKTAKVDSWDDRTYDVTVSASSLIQTVTEADPVDIVLVFDRSGSMNFRANLQNAKECKVSDLDKNKVYYYVRPTKAATVYRVYYKSKKWQYVDDSYWDYSNNKIKSGYTAVEIENATDILNQKDSYTFCTTNDTHDRLYYLKQAATTFTNSLKTKSPNSRVGVVTFTRDANVLSKLVDVGNNCESINKKINAITTAGGTKQSVGLNTAQSLFDNSERAKYVVLLTDGCPADEEPQNVINAATTLKTSTGCTLMTIGVGLNDDNQYLKGAKEMLQGIASNVEYAYDATDASELPNVFNGILDSVVSHTAIEGATVRDYIDPRFEVTDAAGGTIDTDENGRTYVEWTNQTVGSKTGSKAGWSKTIKVKAKDNYIGGNDVTTNGPNSGVIVDGKIFTFPQPKVNVKIDLKLSDKEVTIYKGDSVPTAEEILNRLFNVNATVNKYNNPDYPVSANDFTLTWYAKDKDGNERVVTKDDMANTKPEDTTQYYLRVTYTKAGDTSTESNSNTTKGDTTYVADGKATNINDSAKDYGTYTINVISGTIRITKKVAVSDEERTFTFSIKDENGNVENITITIPANETEASATVDKLARGSYVVSEDTETDYSIEGVVIDSDTDCKNNLNVPAEDQATFVLGNNVENKDVISAEYTHEGKGVLGAITYTNEKVTTNWMIKKVSASDGGNSLGLSNAEFTLTVSGQTTPKYFGKSESDGMVFWYSDAGHTIQVEKLAAGTYELQETVAPNGYQCSTEKWTIVIAKNGSLKSVSTDSDTQITKEFETVNKDMADEKVITCYLYKDEAVYALPSTGGKGIFLYTIGGMLLMGAAAWILYKNKRREVLKR